MIQILEEKPIHTLSMSMGGGMPGPPLAGLASLGINHPGAAGVHKDFDQISMYSQRTDRSAVPRARMYHMERAGKSAWNHWPWRRQTGSHWMTLTLGSINGGYIPEDARSHISHISSKSRVASIADLTGKPPYPGGGLGLSLSRPGLTLFHFLSLT